MSDFLIKPNMSHEDFERCKRGEPLPPLGLSKQLKDRAAEIRTQGKDKGEMTRARAMSVLAWFIHDNKYNLKEDIVEALNFAHRDMELVQSLVKHGEKENKDNA